MNFKDIDGRSWSLKMTLGDFRRFKERYGLDLAADAEAVAQKLMVDETLILELIIDLTRQQRTGTDVESDEVFLDKLSGETLDEAATAFIDSWANCLPKLKRRALQSMNSRITQELDVAADQIATTIANESVEKLAKDFGVTSTASPASSV